MANPLEEIISELPDGEYDILELIEHVTTQSIVDVAFSKIGDTTRVEANPQFRPYFSGRTYYNVTKLPSRRVSIAGNTVLSQQLSNQPRKGENAKE